jgi:2-polyprenyl-6-hydroxyphenyl methylase/3-demethylubiquinone-9 3-methyltransferase
MRQVCSIDGIRATLGQVRNDLAQYDELAGEWWRPGGAFAMLHAIARARARLIPPARGPGEVLVDLGCGAGLLAPHVSAKGYQHVGVDLTGSALRQAAEHGVIPVRGDATKVPLRSGCADVVSAGELLEHVVDLRAAIAEACRLLRPGGLLVLDTINATWLARLVAVTIGERIPAVPKGLHEPNLFVDTGVLTRECARHGVELAVRGLRPAVPAAVRWLFDRRTYLTMTPTRSTAVLYQGRGTKW